MHDEIVAMLQNLVRTPSITGDEAQIAKLVANFCRGLGLDVKIVEAESNRPNIIAHCDSGLPGPSLLLNDHLDIVPPGPLENWSHPPFAAEIADGRVYGRGTIDTKSGLTTILMATKAILEVGMPLRGTLTLVFSCDEEVGGEKGMQFLCKQGHIHADMAVVAEPTTMQVEIATKGRLNIEITTRGVATHGARPWLGHNAIEDMMEVIAGLRRLAQNLELRTHSLLGRATLSIGRIDGGTVPNMVPNKCVLGIDRRVLPTETPENAEAEIQALLDDLKARIPGFEASMRRIVWWPGYTLDEQDPIVNLTCRAFEKVMGKRPNVAGKDAGTDASWINVLSGIPVVMFSPGDGLKAMNADENVRIEDLIAATKVMAQIIHDALAKH
ncbi:MAG: M20 family metallopeptidase [Proteobacteria bacterium]|nr:M20 family metallopeptidase [Pseudomonadota bacterium]